MNENVKDISEWVDPTGMPRNWQRYTVDSIDHLLRDRTRLTMSQVYSLWNIPQRSYHSAVHMMDLVAAVNISLAVAKGWFDNNMEHGLDLHGISECTIDDLILAIVFHDIVYIPGSKYNETASAEMWMAAVNHGPHLYDKRTYDIKEAILMTDYVKYSHEAARGNSLGSLLRTVDLQSCFHASHDEMQRNYGEVYEEVKYLVTPEEFRERNLTFLKKHVYDGIDGGDAAFEKYKTITAEVDLIAL